MSSNRRNRRALIGIVLTGWHVVLKRTRASWPILSANFLTVLLATTLLAAAPIYAQTVAGAGLRQELRDAPVTGANLQVSLNVPGSKFGQADQDVRQALGPIVDLTHGSGTRAGFSSSFGLPESESAGDTKPLAVFGFFDRLADHATLVTGAWPAAFWSGTGPGRVIGASRHSAKAHGRRSIEPRQPRQFRQRRPHPDQWHLSNQRFPGSFLVR